MEGDGGTYILHSVEDVFHDFKARRSALVQALTTDYQEFFQKCDPEKENLCLYGFPSGQWELKLPVEEVPPELPEPALGINFGRDGMTEKEWLSLVSAHCDAWLVAVAFFFGARFAFDRADRKRLFTMINDLPTITEVTVMAKKQGKEKSSVSNHSSNKSKSKRGSESQAKHSKAIQLKYKDEDDQGEEEGDTLCGACGENYDDGFWICCDVCEKWFHGKCVKVTPARAEHMKHYKCPACTNKRARP